MEDHRHGEDGRIIIEAPADAGDVEAVEAIADADVEIAKVNAERDIALAKIDIKREELWQEGRVAQLEGELAGIRETLQKLLPPEPEPEPEPDPAPIVLDPDPLPDEPVVEPPPAAEPPVTKKKAGGMSWF